MKNLKDELVSFKTAKLAKDNGFNIRCRFYYPTENPFSESRFEIKEIGIFNYEHIGELHCSKFIRDNKETTTLQYNIDPYIEAPTQSLLQRWLREEHNILVGVYSNASGWYWERMDNIGGTHRADSDYSGDDLNSGAFTSYELAMESGLLNALQSITNGEK